ncbi:MAG TPA: hypothetical protein VKB52_16845 [Rhodanobacteraceae bacterium]|nr:hypothetical protein [Rhodanobacteraceae bacterium]
MLSRIAIALFGLGLSLAATADELPTLVTSSGSQALLDELLALDDGATQPWALADANSVVPIWSGADGHLLAIVAVPGQWGSPLLAGTTAQPGATSWYLMGASNLDASGVRWQAKNGFHVDALLQQNQSVLPALCGLACDSGRQTGAIGSLGLGWMSADGGLDLSYGLSWLQTRDSVQGFQGIGAGVPAIPVLTLPEAMTYGMQSETSLFARGRWQFAGDAALDVGASYGRGSTLGYATLGSGALPGIDIDQLSLSLGVDAGSLRGAIVGHVLRSDDPLLVGKKWTALDLGVSWRTPWRAEISVGAQNLWSAPLDAPRDTDPNQARTPYIQYRQDL